MQRRVDNASAGVTAESLNNGNARSTDRLVLRAVKRVGNGTQWSRRRCRLQTFSIGRGGQKRRSDELVGSGTQADREGAGGSAVA